MSIQYIEIAQQILYLQAPCKDKLKLTFGHTDVTCLSPKIVPLSFQLAVCWTDKILFPTGGEVTWGLPWGCTVNVCICICSWVCVHTSPAELIVCCYLCVGGRKA